MNTFQIFINGEEYQNAVFPFKYGEFLDEQLDYATITLSRVNKERFKLLSRVVVSVRSRSQLSDEKEQTKEFYYVLSDDNFRESPVGSGLYTHELTLIEPTKLLEGIQVETLCFTNPGARVYNPLPVAIEQQVGDQVDTFKCPDEVRTPVVDETLTFNVLDFIDISTWRPEVAPLRMISSNGSDDYGSVTVLADDLTEKVYKIDSTGNVTILLPFGVSVSTAKFYFATALGVTSLCWFKFSIARIPTKLPLKPWTCQEVIERVLELEKPLLDGMVPRFKLTDDPLVLDRLKHFAPEFTFTRMNLREILQEIGGFIHAEPRLTGENYDTITFDLYGGRTYATYYDCNEKAIKRLSSYNYSKMEGSHGIEEACSAIDSYTDNLVNRLNKDRATVGQPYQSATQTVRAESAYTRIAEDTMMIPTAYPISEIKRLLVKNPSSSELVDITAHVFEETIYNSQLSPYTEVYPSSKAYGLYYTMNGKGIRGLGREVENVTNGVFAKPAIYNILKANGINIENELSDYLSLKFSVEYIPVYSARVTHSKQYIGDNIQTERVLNRSQGENMVETQYFGENLKGQADRLGNPEKRVTFECFNLKTIPKAGYLWDDDYYINNVSVEVVSDRFRVTCSLSKDFNRISKYIGVNSYKRIYEVSEKMVQERKSVYKDYLVITDYTSSTASDNNGFLCDKNTCMQATLRVFKNNGGSAKINAVCVQGHTKNKKETLPKVVLPVISSAFGNVMSFTWNFPDNFSAGMKSVSSSNGNVSGQFGVEVQYADYYGRMYYEDFKLFETDDNTTDPNLYPLAQNVFEVTQIAGTSDRLLIKRKDSRETLSESYSLEFVTDKPNFVIGAGFAANHPFVSGEPAYTNALFVVLKNSLPKYSRFVDLSDDNVLLSMGTNVKAISGYVYFEGYTIDAQRVEKAMAWAYVTPQETVTELFETEDGTTEEITYTKGGELIFGSNEIIFGGKNGVGRFKILPAHDIFEYLKNKEK